MKKSKLKTVCALFLAGVLGATGVVGCNSNDDNGDKAKGNEELIYNLGAEVKTIDPALNNAVDGSIVICNAFEGLMRLDDNQKAIPGIAESYELSDDSLTYTFHLRDDALWSDGKPVTAEDFKYAWTRALNPDTAAEYAFQLYYRKGGENYNNGTGSAEDLGINVVDNHTLEVTLENPTSYFLELTAFPTLMPVREDIVEANGDG